MRTRAFLLRRWEWWVRSIYAPLLTLILWVVVRWATRRGADTRALLGRLGRRALRPSACCPDGDADALLGKRFAAVLGAVRDPRARRALLAPDRLADTRRWMVAAGRVLLLHELRQGLLSWLRGRTGAPAAILTEVQLAVAPDCALRCAGCYARPGHGGPEPTARSILAAVDEAAALGATAVHVIGKGEPLAPRDRGLAVAAAAAARPHLVFTVATSGAGVDDAVIERLRAAGNVFVHVSVDGPEAENDARRGPGSFAEARRTMAQLRARGVPFGFSAMVSRASIEGVSRADHLAALAEAGCLMGAFVRYFPLAADRVDDLLLRPEDTKAWRAALGRARAEAPIPLFDLDELEEDSGCRSRLGRSLYLDALRGEVAPCLRMPFAAEGVPRLGEAPLEVILAHPFFVAYRARAGGHTCGVDLGRELADVAVDLQGHAALGAYRARARRALPIVSPAPEKG